MTVLWLVLVLNGYKWFLREMGIKKPLVLNGYKWFLREIGIKKPLFLTAVFLNKILFIRLGSFVDVLSD
jgi:hypothetical protein